MMYEYGCLLYITINDIYESNSNCYMLIYHNGSIFIWKAITLEGSVVGNNINTDELLWMECPFQHAISASFSPRLFMWTCVLKQRERYGGIKELGGRK